MMYRMYGVECCQNDRVFSLPCGKLTLTAQVPRIGLQRKDEKGQDPKVDGRATDTRTPCDIALDVQVVGASAKESHGRHSRQSNRESMLPSSLALRASELVTIGVRT